MPINKIREFIKLEAFAGILLFLAALAALFVSNSPLASVYHWLLELPISIQIGSLGLEKPLILWINDGLMAIFFLLVGLEIKQEIMTGELNSLSKISLPAICAVGGILAPALMFIYFNANNNLALQGWVGNPNRN